MCLPLCETGYNLASPYFVVVVLFDFFIWFFDIFLLVILFCVSFVCLFVLSPNPMSLLLDM